MVIEDNQITDNGDDGVEVSGILSLSGNHILNNGNNGIVLHAITEQITSIIRENEIAGNTHCAFLVQYSAYGSGLPILIDNQIHDNGLDHGVILTGTLGSNMELVADYYPDITYVIKDLTVNPDVTLTLHPGVVVKFDIDSNLFGEGRLQVNGSDGNE